MPQDVRIDERKLDMLAWLRNYDLLTTHQVALLDGGSQQKVSRILHWLELAGQILRPYGQRQSFYDRREPWIYGLANLGAESLAEQRGIPRGKLDWNKKNRVAKGNYKHKCLLNELRVRLTVDVRHRPEVSYVEKYALNRELPTPVTTWRVTVMDGGKIYEDGVSPDDVFRLIFLNEPKPHNFGTFFPEADRGTEPNDTDTAREVYLYRKMLAYYFTYMLGIHTEHFGFKEFRVPILTTSAERVKNLIEVNKRFNNGKGSEIFLFTDVVSLRASPHVLDHEWINGRGEMVTLLD
jgi:protein involved in plasmid replication-relaxation